MAEALIGHEEYSNTPKRTQTFQATHDGGGNRLPLMHRSFLSFSFGGKYIEDFQLIVTYTQYVTKGIYSEFEDATSTYNTVDGEYYWGTRMAPNHFNFTLSTDYMTQNMLDEFKHWFRPGVERDLILAEHPNRYIRARVAVAPQMAMTPFGEPVKVKIQKYDEDSDSTSEYDTMTTIYRGNIEIEFAATEPYWTGILNYMPYMGLNNGTIEDERLQSLLDQIISNNSLSSEDALKICLEDGIPHDLSLYNSDNYLLGIVKSYNKIILSRSPYSVIENDQETINSSYPEDEWAKVGSSTLAILPPGAHTDISQADEENSRLYDYVLNNEDGADLNTETDQYLFYSGTAPSKPIISFDLELTLNDEGYITHPINKTATPDNQEKSFIKVGNNYFYFTTPGLCTGYNKAIELTLKIKDTANVLELLKEYREKIKDKYARKWAIYCLKDYSQDTNVDSIRNEIINNLKKFFINKYKDIYNYNTMPIEHTRIYYYIASFKFDSKQGIAEGKFICRTPDNPTDGEEITENVGDMILSNYLIIDEKNYLNENGLVIVDNCTPITTNENISNFKILYNNMYY